MANVKYLSYDGLQYLVNKIKIHAIAERITYNDLVTKRNNGELQFGKYYMITDYVTIVNNTGQYISIGEGFAIIVLATSERTLSEEAFAYDNSDEDGYFRVNNANLNAWKLWYCLDNDTNRFEWASGDGKGVIYRMIDEHGNDCPYDFKNIKFRRFELAPPETPSTTRPFVIRLYNNLMDQFRYNRLSYVWAGTYDISGTGTYYWDNNKSVYSTIGGDPKFFFTFSYIDTDDIKDLSITGNYCKNNVIKQYRTRVNKFLLNDIVFFNTESGSNCTNNNLDANCYFNSFGNNCYNNSFGTGCRSNSFGNDCYNNTFSSSCYLNNFGNRCYDNTFASACQTNSFGSGCICNRLGSNCYCNSFGSVNNNIFGNSCYNNSISDKCAYNSFGNYCYTNTVDTGCCANNFMNYCYSNSLSTNCNYNSFGNNCSVILLNDKCNNNSFGNYCVDNMLGDTCNYNRFGNGCTRFRFNSYCEYNSFGNNCGRNQFGGYCRSNSFGNECHSNTFGSYFCNNSFGNSCTFNSFNMADNTSSALRNYCYCNHFDDGCSFIVIWNNASANSSNKLQNIHIKQGVTGTYSAYNMINIQSLNNEYCTTVAKTSSNELLIYCEEDCLSNDEIDTIF